MSLDISLPGSFDWTIGISDEEVLKDTRFALQFLPIDASYSASKKAEITSPGFNLLLVNQQSPPNGTVGATLPSSTATTSSATSASASAIQSYLPSDIAQNQNSNGLSAGGIAGVVIAVFAIILSAILVGYILFKRQQRKNVAIITEDEKVNGPYEVLGDRQQAIEMSSKDTAVYELSHSRETLSSQEVGGSQIHEAYTTIKRPGLHELPS